MKLVKTIFLVLVFFVMVFCQDRELNVAWDQYTDPADIDEVEFFIVYKWQGSDTLAFSQETMTVVDTVAQDPLRGEFFVPTLFTDGLYIKAACVAFDSLGRGSEWAFTRYYKPPDIPKNIRIQQNAY